MNNPQDTLNLKEVAELLGMSERTIYNWAQTKYIPSFKLGKSWRFNKSEITQWINSNREGPITEPNIYPMISAYDPLDEYMEQTDNLKEIGEPVPGAFSPSDLPSFLRFFLDCLVYTLFFAQEQCHFI